MEFSILFYGVMILCVMLVSMYLQTVCYLFVTVIKSKILLNKSLCCFLFIYIIYPYVGTYQVKRGLPMPPWNGGVFSVPNNLYTEPHFA